MANKPSPLRKENLQLNILFITATRLGDAVMSMGILATLVERYPNAQITIACGPVPAPLFRAVPNVARIIVLNKLPFNGHWLRLLTLCWRISWDRVVDLRKSIVGRLLLANHYHTRSPHQHLHKVEDNAAVLDLAVPPAPRLWLDDAARAAAAAALPSGVPLLAIGPTANWQGKIWPPSRFAKLLQELTANGGIFAGYKIVLFGAPGEERQVAPILKQLPPDDVINLVGKLDPLAAAAALGRCAFFIGNDSGLMHIAAAMDVPTLGLFGPSMADVYRPWGTHTSYVKTDLTLDELTGSTDYNHKTTPSLMNSLSVEKVILAAQDLYDSIGRI